MTLSHTVTHVNIREKSHRGTKCPKILFRFVRSLKSEASTLWGRSRLHEGNDIYSWLSTICLNGLKRKRSPLMTPELDVSFVRTSRSPGVKHLIPILLTRYLQWRSRFLRYIDTKPNGEGLRKSILSGPYVPSTVLVQAVAASEGNPAIQQHTTIETVLNMTPENKEHFLSEKEAIFLLLTGIGDEIYSTVDACKTANEMWIAIERLQQGESLNVQDVKTNLFWEFGKFTSRDGESMESYYSRFYKLMNELTRNNLQVTTMQVNEDIDLEQAQRKRYAKELALLQSNFKKLYKPTNNNLRTSSNSRNKTEDTTPRYNNDNQSGQFGNQRTMTVAGTRETVGSPVVQQTRIQCFNCKGFGHYAKECRKPKRIDEQELEAHYSFIAKIQEVLPGESSSTEQPLEQVQNHDENNVFANERRHSEQPESINDTYVLEKDDSNVTPDSSNICNNDNQVDQNATECVDERAALANLIVNLTLDTEENKTILKQLKKANASLTQEIEECKTNLDETSRALGEPTSCRDSCLIALQKQRE
ncbi:retrovirus-related pol polyprotein from transposon TNT 1-94 [Tanacetum coccineum]|uniref:Retrovirus-related pol polyprotein from transposon TNT 1-94 n=1 Tax=Tanacetum coccineum TaxID=301880 RepID=A0ABQ5EC14_9ASTR